MRGIPYLASRKILSNSEMDAKNASSPALIVALKKKRQYLLFCRLSPPITACVMSPEKPASRAGGSSSHKNVTSCMHEVFSAPSAKDCSRLRMFAKRPPRSSSLFSSRRMEPKVWAAIDETCELGMDSAL